MNPIAVCAVRPGPRENTREQNSRASGRPYGSGKSQKEKSAWIALQYFEEQRWGQQVPSTAARNKSQPTQVTPPGNFSLLNYSQKMKRLPPSIRKARLWLGGHRECPRLPSN